MVALLQQIQFLKRLNHWNDWLMWFLFHCDFLKKIYMLCRSIFLFDNKYMNDEES
jgi:hypothetical protein